MAGATGVVLWAVPVVAALITREPVEEDALAESIGIGVLVVLNVAGVLIAFRHERFGGRVLLATGVAFAVFALLTAGRNHWLAAAVSGGPFMLSGALFLRASSHP